MRKFRNTARGIVTRNGQILLMERWRPGMHYFSIPGGGIEQGETPEQTVAREILEETTVTIEVERQVLEMRDGDLAHKIYLCRYADGEPHMPEHAPEFLHASADNRFKPGWVAFDGLENMDFNYWSSLKPHIIKGLNEGFASETQIVTLDAAG